MFVDLSGSTASAERLDPEEWRRVLQRYFSVLARQIARYGGTIDKYIGDAVMAVFGAPIAREDDPHRAITAALAIKTNIASENDTLEREYGVRLNLRIGINTGEVIAGILEGGMEGAYTVTGDTVNTAQRFESAAPTNEILVGQATYQLARRSFVFEQLAPLTLKGKKDPVPAYRVRFAERRAIPRDERAPFVGRTAELALLQQAFAEARAGRGQVVHVHGEAGVGKSRLMQEFFASLPRDATRLWPRCTSYEMETPYALVADMIRRAFRIQRGEEDSVAASTLTAGLAARSLPTEGAIVSVLLEVLGYGARSALDPEKKRRLLASILDRFVDTESRRNTLVVVLEDVHWIDGPSAALFREIVPAVIARGCLFVSNSRDASVPWEATVVPVDPLREDAATEMLDRASPIALDPATRASVLERTAGNPFFIEEVVRGLGTRTTGTVPETVQELLQARLDRLGPAAKRVAQRAAVVGRTFSTRLLEELLRNEPLEPALAELEADGFVMQRAVVPERLYMFRHALMQEAAYQVQLLSQRKALHGDVGTAIEALYAGRLGEFVDPLAFHFGRSDNDDKAVTWLSSAGDRAAALFANDEALGQYRSALARARANEIASGILERMGDVQTRMGRYDDALTSLDDSQRRAQTAAPTTVARLQRKTGMTLVLKGSFAEAFATYERGLAMLRDEAEAEAPRIESQIGQLHWRTGDYAAARGALVRAVATAERLGADDVVADALKQLGNLSLFAGDPKDAEAFYLRSRTISERREDLAAIAGVRINLGDAYVRQGRWEQALAEFAAALSMYERIGNPWAVSMIHNNIGEVQRLHGNIAEAIPAFERAVSISRSIGDKLGLGLALTGLGAVRVDAGQVVQGRADLLEAEALFKGMGSTTYLPDLYRFLASAQLAERDLDAATWAAERSLTLADAAGAEHQRAITERVLAEIALARGDTARARDLLRSSSETLRRVGEVAELARTETLLAQIAL